MVLERVKFYICKHCGNIVRIIHASGVPLVCCGENMNLIVPNTSDGAFEKHVPVVKVNGNTVTVEVGQVPHPMIDKHYISWIYIQTEKGEQIKMLTPSDKPVAEFSITSDDKVQIAYAYCNLHGLWKAEV